jgi:hypothetical protein
MSLHSALRYLFPPVILSWFSFLYLSSTFFPLLFLPRSRFVLLPSVTFYVYFPLLVYANLNIRSWFLQLLRYRSISETLPQYLVFCNFVNSLTAAWCRRPVILTVVCRQMPHVAIRKHVTWNRSTINLVYAVLSTTLSSLEGYTLL